ncbi:hypothetical protein PMAYCL1PPCAC_27663, partial [Pristionchus mayeri]
RRQIYFKRLTMVTVPLGILIACYTTYEADVRNALVQACLVMHIWDAISCVLCAIAYFRSRNKYRVSFTHVTLDTRFLLSESQDLT